MKSDRNLGPVVAAPAVGFRQNEPDQSRHVHRYQKNRRKSEKAIRRLRVSRKPLSRFEGIITFARRISISASACDKQAAILVRQDLAVHAEQVRRLASEPLGGRAVAVDERGAD